MIAVGDSKSRAGNSAGSKVTVSYTGLQYDYPNKRGRITSPKFSFYSKSGWSDSTNRGRVRGSAVTDETVFTNKTLNGGTDTWSVTAQWVGLSHTGTTGASFIGEVAGVSFYENDNNSDYYGPNLGITFARVPYSVPAAPAVLEFGRVSDAVQRLTWAGNQNNAEVDGFWHYVDAELQTDSEAAAWVGLGALPGTATSLDVATAVNRRYRVRIRSRNVDQSSAWVTTGWIATSPAAPTGVAATKAGGNAVVTWANAAAFRSRTDVERSDDEAEFGAVVDVGQAGAYTHTGPTESQSHRYRVRAVITAVPLAGGGTIDLTSAWVTTGLLFAVPAAPTASMASRLSDSVQRLTWSLTNPASVTAPYQSQRIQRQVDDDTAPWLDLTSVAGTVTTTDDPSTEPNRRYRYRIRAENSGGASAWTSTDWIATSPAPPTGVAATKAGQMIRTSWTNTGPWRTGSQLQHAPGGENFDPALLTPDSGPSAVSYTDDDAEPSLTHRYRVRAVVAGVPLAAGGTIDLTSAWVTTGLVQLLTKPNPPLVTVAAGPFDATLTAWTAVVGHQSVDSTVQADADLQWRKVGDPDWVSIDLGLATAHTWPAGTLTNPATYEVRARTRGEHPDWSDWSASAVFTTSATPTATITAPADGGSIGSNRVRVTAVYFDPDATSCSQWAVRILDATLAQVWSGTYPGAPAIDVEPAYPLPDDSAAVVQVRARDGSGLWSAWAQAAFSVEYDPPPTPEPVATFDPGTGAVTLTITSPDPGEDQAPPVFQRVTRHTSTGQVVIAESAPIGTPAVSVTDPIPPLCQIVTYTVEAVTATGSTAIGTVEVATDTDWLFVNGGPGWSQQARLSNKMPINVSPASDKVLRRYAGSRDPVSKGGAGRSYVVQVSGEVATYPGDELADAFGSWPEWEAIETVDDPLCYRDPLGRRFFASLSDLSIANAADPVSVISARFTRIRHVE